MSEPFLGQIELFGFNFPPKTWAFCAGQTLPIAQNQALFSLLGTTYGGDGITTFKLPDLRSRIPVGVSSTIPQGSVAGEEQHVLQIGEIPAHVHSLMGDASAGSSGTPGPTVTFGVTSGKAPAGAFTVQMYGTAADTTLDPRSIASAGANAGHENRAPYLALNPCIALQGIYPSRS